MEAETALTRIRPFFDRPGESPDACAAFERMYRSYRSGESGTVDWAEVSPAHAADLIPFDRVEGAEFRAAGARRLGEVAWIVLNGGLGTSMQMERAKGLVAVKEGLSFLELICGHVQTLRRRSGARLPVLFMNSFATRDDTLAHVARFGLEQDSGALPVDFVQHRFPRLREKDGLPLGDPDDPEAWAPPGHGDVYPALRGSGLLAKLLARGVRWAFISNVDNLGASVHPGVLELMAREGYEFLMEVTPKTQADVKGGTLVRRRGRIELLELAQVPEARRAEFCDPEAFPVFNTNNLWVDLAALERLLAERPLDLPLIVNRKIVRETPAVQLETAMGAAIRAFGRAAGLLVPRTRFAPVKTTDDLLARRSDAYVTGEESPLVPNPGRDPALGPPVVRLDPVFYGSVADLELRIPHALSLVHAGRLEVRGDVRFGRDVAVRGAVELTASPGSVLRVPDGARLSGE